MNHQLPPFRQDYCRRGTFALANHWQEIPRVIIFEERGEFAEVHFDQSSDQQIRREGARLWRSPYQHVNPSVG